MAAWAAEAIVKVEVPKGGIKIVSPEQADHTTAEPDAFRITGRAVNGLGSVCQVLGFLGGGILGGISRSLGLGLFGGFGIVVLREGWREPQNEGRSQSGG